MGSNKSSIVSISAVIVLLVVILFIGGISLQEKNRNYKAKEAELMAELEEARMRAKEIEELQEYVGTDTYVEDVAKEKLGLINPNEILFKVEP